MAVLSVALLACGGEATEPCADVDCGGGGACSVQDGAPVCTCDSGLVAAGLECVEPTVEPEVVYFAAEPAEIRQGESTLFTLTVSGPEGVDYPVDAHLETATGQLITELLPAGQPRTYTAELSWADINQFEEITFLQDRKRTFVARLEADDGFADQVETTLTLTCLGVGACRGECRGEMLLHESLPLTAETACPDWTCNSEKYPRECLQNPTAYLWISDEQFDVLMSDVKADIEVDGFYHFLGQCGEVGIELHGGLARKFDKKSFKMKFNREGRFSLDPFAEPPAPDPIGFKQLIFKAHWVDPTLMRDRLTHHFTRAAGGLAPRVTHSNLVLNGKYHGVYALTESILKDFFQRMELPAEGNLYKAVNHNANLKKKGNPLAGYEKKMNPDGDSDDLAELLDVISSAPSGCDEFTDAVGAVIDLDLYQAFTLANALTNNQDAFTKNYYLYHEGDGSLPFLIVNWDADATWGISWDGTPEDPEGGGIWGTKNGLSKKLAAIDECQASYSSDFLAALDNLFAYESTSAEFAAATAQVEPDIRFEECRWEKESSFAEQLEVVDDFLQKRPEYLRGLLEAVSGER